MSVGTSIDPDGANEIVSVPYVRDVRWDSLQDTMLYNVSVPYVRDVRWDRR